MAWLVRGDFSLEFPGGELIGCGDGGDTDVHSRDRPLGNVNEYADFADLGDGVERGGAAGASGGDEIADVDVPGRDDAVKRSGDLLISLNGIEAINVGLVGADLSLGGPHLGDAAGVFRLFLFAFLLGDDPFG